MIEFSFWRFAFWVFGVNGENETFGSRVVSPPYRTYVAESNGAMIDESMSEKAFRLAGQLGLVWVSLVCIYHTCYKGGFAVAG